MSGMARPCGRHGARRIDPKQQRTFIKGEIMRPFTTTSAVTITALAAMVGSVCAEPATDSDLKRAQASQPADNIMLAEGIKRDEQGQEVLKGSKTVLGKVEAVTSDQVKVNIGEVQPRFLPLKQAQEKHFPDIKEGDDLIITVNEQNLLVDYHPLDIPPGDHKVVRGSIADDLPIGQDRVVIKGEDGQQQSYEVRSQARSKLAAIQIGAPAIFLLDETNKVADVQFANVGAAKSVHNQPEGTGGKSSIKGANRKVNGTVVEPLHADRITIKTHDGERPFEVRDVMHDRISKLQKGESVILMVDNENKVVDVAVPPQ
jgi:hypothetical protein